MENLYIPKNKTRFARSNNQVFIIATDLEISHPNSVNSRTVKQHCAVVLADRRETWRRMEAGALLTECTTTWLRAMCRKTTASKRPVTVPCCTLSSRILALMDFRRFIERQVTTTTTTTTTICFNRKTIKPKYNQMVGCQKGAGLKYQTISIK